MTSYPEEGSMARTARDAAGSTSHTPERRRV